MARYQKKYLDPTPRNSIAYGVSINQDWRNQCSFVFLWHSFAIAGMYQTDFPVSGRYYSGIYPGGFVAMSPENHDEYVCNWARQTKSPIISINYGKAPEHPYPWGLEECFDAYRSICESNGKCLGMAGWENGTTGVARDPIRVIFVGDSAGGTLVTGVIMKCLEYAGSPIPAPHACILIYPALSFDLECWMKPSHLSLLRTESHVNVTDGFMKTKTQVRKDMPLAIDESPRSIDVLTNKVDTSHSFLESFSKEGHKGPYVHSNLSMTSRMHYFNDRVLTPEYLRAMAIMYLADSPIVPDLKSDYYISPILAPQDILSQFPKTYFLCGEKDPFVDDTIVFANLIRQSKIAAKRGYERMGVPCPPLFSIDAKRMTKVKILPGMSHAFFQCYSFLPESKQAVRLTSDWFIELFKDDYLDGALLSPVQSMSNLNTMKIVEEATVLKKRRMELASVVFKRDGDKSPSLSRRSDARSF